MENKNEITHHFLECIFAHLTNISAEQTKFDSNNNHQMNNNMNNMNTMNNMNNMNNNNNNNNMNDSNNNGGFGDNALNNNGDGDYALNPLQKKIAVIMQRNSQDDKGCNVEVVFNQLPSEDINNIRYVINYIYWLVAFISILFVFSRNAIEEMSEIGFLYSTIDDDHYKCSHNWGGHKKEIIDW